MKPAKALSLVIAVLIAQFSYAQEAVSMSLAQAQQYALEHGFAVTNARLDAAKAEREVKETLSIGLPQVTGSIDYNNYIDIPVQVAPADAFGFPDYLNQFLFDVSNETGVALNAPEPDPDAISEFQFGTPQTITAGIQATQIVFDGSYFVGIQASRAYADAMRNGIEKSEVETKEAVASAYHTVLVAQENSRILSESLGLLKDTFEETQALYENGFAEEMDVDQLRLNLADLESRIKYADQQAEVALDMLKFQIGMDLAADLTLTDNVESLTGDTGASMLSTPFNIENNPDFKMQRSYVNLAELGVKNEKARALPSIGAFYSYQRNAQRDEFNFLDFDQKWYPIQLWGVQMTVPIFGSTQGYQRIEKAKVDLARAEEALFQVEQGAKLEFTSARIDFDNSLEQREIQKQNLELAEKIFNKTQIKYNEGVASSFELSQSQSQLLTTQGNYINATLQLLNARARLNKALNNF
ncbi:TolC family protein [Sanyastnella coralliicola]|uniref:TolC family protein n=1 Tax=Sanyastnella coralliicola TaxID=3069118 RepID=UPI0027B94A85|nr:TolC family protein [Longitalea sp. SCSIO 12813]